MKVGDLVVVVNSMDEAVLQKVFRIVGIQFGVAHIAPILEERRALSRHFLLERIRLLSKMVDT